VISGAEWPEPFFCFDVRNMCDRPQTLLHVSRLTALEELDLRGCGWLSQDGVIRWFRLLAVTVRPKSDSSRRLMIMVMMMRMMIVVVEMLMMISGHHGRAQEMRLNHGHGM
jgi:hypothetical protein